MDSFFTEHTYALPVACLVLVALFILAAWFRAFWFIAIFGMVSAALAAFAAFAAVLDLYGIGVGTWQPIAGLSVVVAAFCWATGMYIRGLIASDNGENNDEDSGPIY